VSSACCVVGRVRGLLPDGILITFGTPMCGTRFRDGDDRWLSRRNLTSTRRLSQRASNAR
jgi:hypothetical protein